MYSDTIVTTEATLCTIIKDDKILLQKKAEGRFGEGKWNSPGGKIRPDEPPEACVVREVIEETGIIVRSPRLHGVLRHYFGEKTDDYVIVRTNTQEFDYPSGDENVYGRYEGEGGIGLGSFARRLIYAWQLGDALAALSKDWRPRPPTTRNKLHNEALRTRLSRLEVWFALPRQHPAGNAGRR